MTFTEAFFTTGMILGLCVFTGCVIFLMFTKDK